MKFGKLVEYKKRKNSFRNYVENEAGREFQASFCFLKKLYMR